jgi:hypothetical protein
VRIHACNPFPFSFERPERVRISNSGDYANYNNALARSAHYYRESPLSLPRVL